MKKRKKSEIEKICILTVEKLGKPQSNLDHEFLSLKKGQYDREYVLNLIKIIEKTADNGKMDGYNLALTLKVGLEKLRKSIEEEIIPKNDNPYVPYVCPNCGQYEIIHRNIEHIYSCNCQSKPLLQ